MMKEKKHVKHWRVITMSKERLEEIKMKFNNSPDVMLYVPRADMQFLIEQVERLKSEYDHLKTYIENSEATCEICGDYFMPNVTSEETLYYCGNCREEV